MTPAQKATETRKRNQEAREARTAENREIKAKIKESLLTVIEHREATPAEKLEASKLLLNLI